jgi:hypothetical protein
MTIFDCPVVPKVYKQLDSKGLYVYAVFITKGLAECYLPKFMGGDGGELIEKITSWVNDNNIERINRRTVREYTTKNNIQISKSLESQILRDLKKEGSAFSYIPDVEKKLI